MKLMKTKLLLSMRSIVPFVKFVIMSIFKLKNIRNMTVNTIKYFSNPGKIMYEYLIRICKIEYVVYIVKIIMQYMVQKVKKVIGAIINYLKIFVKRVLNGIMLITLDKLFGLFLGALFFASLKYAISGCLSINWEDFNLNFSLAFIGGIFRSLVNELLFEYLNLKGVNYNIDQLLFGLNKQKMGSGNDLGEFKPRLYNPMDIDDEPSLGQSLDKGKGVSQDLSGMSGSTNSGNDKPLDKVKNFSEDNNSSGEESNGDKTKRLDKGKGVDRRNIRPNDPRFIDDGIPYTKYPIAWNDVGTGTYTTAYMPNFPPKINPGPGFNVPGGVVPIRDEICRHIEWNSHVLTQFRNMDLETAIEQYNNNLKMIEVQKRKLEFGQIKLAKEGVGQVPMNDHHLWLINKVESEAKWLNENIVRGEGRNTLLLSRIEFIQIEESKKNNK